MPQESIEWEEVFQLVMDDIEKRYRVSDELSDVLSDSLSKHLPNAITTALAKRELEIADELRDLPGRTVSIGRVLQIIQH